MKINRRHQPQFRNRFRGGRTKLVILVLGVLLFGGLGVYSLHATHAKTATASIETEDGTTSRSIPDTSASKTPTNTSIAGATRFCKLPTVTQPSSKKGVVSRLLDTGDTAVDSKLNVSWAYDYGYTIPAGFAGHNIEYIPMVLSDKRANDPAIISSLWQDGRAKKFDTLLGFNEPDGVSGGVNMTVDQAIADWPALESTCLRLGAPAVTSIRSTKNTSTPGKAWIDDFMEKAQARGYRVDFVPLHYYLDWTTPDAASITTISNDIAYIHNTYNVPVWITEVGTIDIAHAFTPAQHMRQPANFADASTYMQDLTTMLNNNPNVERYAWYVDKRWADPADSDYAVEQYYNFTSLFDNSNNLTALGTTYSNVQ